MSIAKNIRVSASMTFPHFVKIENSGFVKIAIGDSKEPKTATVMGGGYIDLIYDPKEPIKLGDILLHPFIAEITYQVTSVSGERYAKGIWGNLTPVWCRASVQLTR